MSNQVISSTDCRTPVGVTVGLIDGIIAMARVLKTMDQSSPEVQEALMDLRADEDILDLLGLSVEKPMTPEVAFQEWNEWLNKNGRRYEIAMAHDLFFIPGHEPGENPFVGMTSKRCKEKLEALHAVDLSRYQ